MERVVGSKFSDVELINLYLKLKNTYYFGILYKRYSDKVYSKCNSIIQEENQAKDATQDIFLKIYLNLSKFSAKSKFSTWVYSITYNHCIDYLRRRKKDPKYFFSDFSAIPGLFSEPEVEKVLNPEREIEIDSILNQLTIGDKAILQMKYIEGMSILEISKALEKTESAIKMRLKRARSRAKNVYSEYNN